VYAFSRIQFKQDGLKLKGKHHILVYADYVNIYVGKLHAIKIEALVATGKEFGLKLNVDKTRYVVISRVHKTGRIHNIKNDICFFVRRNISYILERS